LSPEPRANDTAAAADTSQAMHKTHTNGAGLDDYLAAQRALPPTAELRRAIRRAARVTLQQIGDECGVTGEAVRCWELGLCPPTGQHLVQYVRVLERLKAAA
jgi:DNA-binding transcriptional regulator YiaG